MTKYRLTLFLGTIIVLLIISCKKSNSGGNSNEAAISYVSSAISTSSQQMIIDSFTYDSTHRLDTYMITIYDTTSGYAQYNSQVLKFIYIGSNTYPLYYNAYDTALGNTDGDYHLLSYDAQNRITKDTSLSGSGYVAYYSYPNNNLASTVLWEGTLQDNMVDTLYMANGNMGNEVIYNAEIPGQPDVLQGDINFSYASIANPCYHAAIANSIGPVLFIASINGDGDFVDFNSKNAYEGASGIQQGGPIVAFKYTLANDSKGRLSHVTGSAAGATGTIVYNYY
jgi:hypothetical protein